MTTNTTSDDAAAFAALTRDDLVQMLRTVRTLAWISYSDDRTIEEKDTALRQILVTTRLVGNEPPQA